MVSQAERLSRGCKEPQRVSRWVLMCDSLGHSPYRWGRGMRSPHSRYLAGGRPPLDCVPRCHQTPRAHGYGT